MTTPEPTLVWPIDWDNPFDVPDGDGIEWGSAGCEQWTGPVVWVCWHSVYENPPHIDSIHAYEASARDRLRWLEEHDAAYDGGGLVTPERLHRRSDHPGAVHTLIDGCFPDFNRETRHDV